jgi:putative transposase
MSRALRLEYEGAVYHVTSRGNERAAIFRDDMDRARFLEIVGRVASHLGWIVHAYCLMGNHYHLLLETPRGNLSPGMQRINGRYTQFFNRRHRRVGHLLQGRYKAIHVEKEEHLLELCRYVVLNPVRARLVEQARDWRWSSYPATAGRTPPPKWLEVDWTLSQFGRRRKLARRIFERFVADGRRAQSPLKKVRHQIYLGGESFMMEMEARLKGIAAGEDIPERQRSPSPPSIEAVRKAVAGQFGVAEADLSRSRGGEDKMAGIYLASILTGKTGSEVGRAFGVKPARVSNIVSEVEAGTRPALVKRIRGVRKALETAQNV